MRFFANILSPLLAKEAILKAIEGYGDLRKIRRELWKMGYRGAIRHYEHHLCHAALAYYTSPFAESAVMINDGVGERASTTLYHAKEGKFRKVLEVSYPDSLGAFYKWMTWFCGFGGSTNAGKLMGLAAYGENTFVNKFKKLITLDARGYRLNFSYFNFNRNNREGLTKRFYTEFGDKRAPEDALTQTYKDIAYATQVTLEEAILHLATILKKKTRSEHICLGGGVSLNASANAKLLYSKLFKEIHLYPACGDDGVYIGAAVLAYYTQHKNTDHLLIRNTSPYLGYDVAKEDVEKVLIESRTDYQKIGAGFMELLATKLSEGAVIALCRGRAEIGPRALGNRSILADPRSSILRDSVSQIKKRESFRPFAPVVLEKDADTYFDMEGTASKYMLFNLTVKNDYRDILQGITHVDGTARVQTITENDNEFLFQLLNSYKEKTGLPVLLNTSFNIQNPMINDARQAIDLFLKSEIDYMILNDYIVSNHSSTSSSR